MIVGISVVWWTHCDCFGVQRQGSKSGRGHTYELQSAAEPSTLCGCLYERPHLLSISTWNAWRAKFTLPNKHRRKWMPWNAMKMHFVFLSAGETLKPSSTRLSHPSKRHGVHALAPSTVLTRQHTQTDVGWKQPAKKLSSRRVFHSHPHPPRLSVRWCPTTQPEQISHVIF